MPHRADVANLFPSSKPFVYRGLPRLVLPHDIQATLTLRQLGMDIPAPVMSQYDWPHPPAKPPFVVQQKTVAMLTTCLRAYVLNDMGCVDADTEYLSSTGWKRIADYTGGKVGQYHPTTGVVEMVEPTEFVKKPCAEMIRFKTTRGVDQLLSPEHRVLLADGVVKRADQIEAEYGTRYSRLNHKFRATFTVDRPGIPYSDAEIRLMVAVNADGYNERGEHIIVRLKRARKITRLSKLLGDAAVASDVRICRTTGFTVFSFYAPAPKGFGATWWEASQAQLRIVADEAVHWDGSARKAGGLSFTSYTIADADFIQYAYSAAGCRASLNSKQRGDRVEHTVYAKDGGIIGLYGVGKDGSVRSNVWREPSPDGYKYCFVVPTSFLILRRNGCVFATGNTGKTASVVWAFDYLASKGLATKMLVICPLSTMEETWLKHFYEFTPERKAVVLTGTAARRKKLLADTTADIYIINHDGLQVVLDELVKRPDIDCVAIDELAVYRNARSNRTKAITKFVAKRRWVWGLTGRPAPHEPTDVWAQCQIVTPHTVPTRWTHFRDDLMFKKGAFKWIAKPNAVETAVEAMRPAVRFSMEDVTELPDITFDTVKVPMELRQAEVFNAMRLSAVAKIASHQIDAMNAGAVLNKLLQISAGWVYTRDGQTIDLKGHGRLTRLVDDVEANSGKTIVFVPFVSALEGVAEALTRAGNRVAMMSGATPSRLRAEIFAGFQSLDEYDVLVAHPQCMAHGVTLTTANQIIWYAPTTSLEIFEQANARIRRVGQKLKQIIRMYVGSTAERHIYTILRSRQKVQDQMLAIFEANTVYSHK